MNITVFYIDTIPIGIRIYKSSGAVGFEYHSSPVLETGRITSIDIVANNSSILGFLLEIYSAKEL